MVLELDNDNRVEFTNISREELQGLNDYIHSTLIPAMKRDASVSASDDEQDNHLEETVAASSHESVEVVKVVPKRIRRKAAHEARMTTKSQLERGIDSVDDEDEDEDYHATVKPDDVDDSEDEEDDESEDDEEEREDDSEDDDNDHTDHDVEEEEEDDDDHLEGFEEEEIPANGDETESEDDKDNEPKKKRART
jgi:hypothetical protein